VLVFFKQSMGTRNRVIVLARQATLASGIGSLESIPRLHNMKNEDEDNFFWIKAKKNEYIRTSAIEETKKNEFIRS
jgi:hypothetical protein